jgi:hypothetical protein
MHRHHVLLAALFVESQPPACAIVVKFQQGTKCEIGFYLRPFRPWSSAFFATPKNVSLWSASFGGLIPTVSCSFSSEKSKYAVSGMLPDPVISGPRRPPAPMNRTRFSAYFRSRGTSSMPGLRLGQLHQQGIAELFDTPALLVLTP